MTLAAKQFNIAWHEPVRVATTGPGTLASDFEAGDSIDGVVLATGDRILIKDQAAGAENGIYFVNGAGAPTREKDAVTGRLNSGGSVFVSEGATNGTTAWWLTNTDPITVGVDALVWAMFAGGAAAASAWSAVLAVGNTSGGSDAVMTAGDDLAGVDAAGAAGGVLTLRAGDHTGGGATSDNGGDTTCRAGDTNATGASANGGAMTVRAGDTDGTGASLGGALLCQAGTAATAIGGSATFAAGDMTAGGNTGGQATLRGGDNITGTGLSNGTGGPALVRGGDSPAIGAVRNGDGGNLNLRGGNHRTGISGTPASAGGVFMRSGSLDASAGSTFDTSGDIRITTDAVNGVGNMPGVGGSGTDTGNIRIDTTGQGATANVTGDIDIECGTLAGAGFSGNDPGDVTVSAGGMLVTTQGGVAGGSATINGGDAAGTSGSPGGAATLNGGDQTDGGADGTSPGGAASINGGDSAKNSATSGGGAAEVNAGDASGVAGPGGDANVNGGDQTNVAGTGRGGDVNLSAGTVTAGGTGRPGRVNMVTDGSANPIQRRTIELTTTAAGTTDIPLSTIATPGQFVMVEVFICGGDQLAPQIDFYTRKICTAYNRETAAVAEIARVIDTNNNIGAPTWSANLTVSGDTIRLSITGVAARTVDWKASIEVTEKL